MRCKGQGVRRSRARGVRLKVGVPESSDLKPFALYLIPDTGKFAAISEYLPERWRYEINSIIFLLVYSPVSARASTGRNDRALLERRHVAEAGNSSSAR